MSETCFRQKVSHIKYPGFPFYAVIYYKHILHSFCRRKQDLSQKSSAWKNLNDNFGSKKIGKKILVRKKFGSEIFLGQDII